MEDGTISGNTASLGGGVFVDQNGSFTMTEGTISGNTASLGGGVYAYGGTFAMNGGTIDGNSASDSVGVYLINSSSKFTLNGGYLGEDFENNGTVSISGGYFGGEIENNRTVSISGGAIAGIVLGSVFGALILAYAICALLYKKKILKGAFFAKIYPFIKD